MYSASCKLIETVKTPVTVTISISFCSASQ
jgi:hypothetical protein